MIEATQQEMADYCVTMLRAWVQHADCVKAEGSECYVDNEDQSVKHTALCPQGLAAMVIADWLRLSHEARARKAS